MSFQLLLIKRAILKIPPHPKEDILSEIYRDFEINPLCTLENILAVFQLIFQKKYGAYAQPWLSPPTRAALIFS